MPEEVKLETPSDPGQLYMARTADDLEEFRHRPAFTGDVYESTDRGLLALVQHPCAMRRGPELVERLLVCAVKPRSGGIRSDWSTGDYKRMFLPDLDGGAHTIEFEEIDVIERDELQAASRRTILAQTGVNLLMQRWVHHNTRVVIPTITIALQTAGPFDEADLTGDACADLTARGIDESSALTQVDQWLSRPHRDGERSRREMLEDPQQRSVVRSTLRQQVKVWITMP